MLVTPSLPHFTTYFVQDKDELKQLHATLQDFTKITETIINDCPKLELSCQLDLKKCQELKEKILSWKKNILATQDISAQIDAQKVYFSVYFSVFKNLLPLPQPMQDLTMLFFEIQIYLSPEQIQEFTSGIQQAHISDKHTEEKFNASEEKLKASGFDENTQNVFCVHNVVNANIQQCISDQLADKADSPWFNHKIIVTRDTQKTATEDATAQNVIQAVGLILFEKEVPGRDNENCIHLTSLLSAPWNLPEYRQISDQQRSYKVKGADTALVSFCAQQSFEKGYQGRIYVNANRTSQPFYTKLGFSALPYDTTTKEDHFFGNAPYLLEGRATRKLMGLN